MKKQGMIAGALVAALAAAGADAQSLVTNPDFSAGLGGWTHIGDAIATNGQAFVGTDANNDDDGAGAGAFNLSGTPAVASTNLEAFAGLLAGALDPDPLLDAIEGSAIQQTFTVNPGWYVAFDWRLLSNEADGDLGVDDYAFVVINGVVSFLGTRNTLTSLPGGLGFARESDVFRFATGTYASQTTVTLTIGVIDVQDGTVTSGLLIDNVIPEPGAVAGVIAALAGAVALRRRSIKKQ